jgi:hypothetical protein
LQEPGKELQVPGSRKATVHCKALEHINFDKLGRRSFRQLRDLFSELDGSPVEINPPLDLFGSPASPISIFADDYAALLTPNEWLSAPVVQIWML